MTIRNRPEKDTTNPPGQIRYLRDVIKKYQDEDRGYTKSFDGCCHKTVTTRCPECPHREVTPKQAVELLRNSGVSEAFLKGQAPYPSTDAEKRSGAVLGPLASAYLKQYGFAHWQAQEVEAKLERLKGALLAYCEAVDHNERQTRGLLPATTAGIRKILEENS